MNGHCSPESFLNWHNEFSGHRWTFPQNAKLPNFYARNLYYQAMGVDALMVEWTFQSAYAFPPVLMIFTFLKHLLGGKSVTVLAVLSDLPRRPWSPLLLQLSLRPPLPSSLVGLIVSGPAFSPSIPSAPIYVKARKILEFRMFCLGCGDAHKIEEEEYQCCLF